MKKFDGYEPTIREPRKPLSDEVKYAILAVSALAVVVFGLVGGCQVWESSQHRQLQTCVENGGEWVFPENKDGEKDGTSKVCQKSESE